MIRRVLNRPSRWAALAFAASALLPVTVPATQPLSEIRAAVEQFLQARSAGAGENQKIEVGHLDPRLRLHRCTTPLAPFLPTGGWRRGNVTVGVKCTGRQRWTIYVTASVRRFEEVVVASRALHREHILAAGDLILERRDTTDLRNGYFTSVEDALHLRLRRTVAQGTHLSPAAVAKRIAVKRGQRVTLVAGDGALVVRSVGEALSDGATGEVVRVRNSRSQMIVDGVVTEPGVVRVGT